MLELLVAGRRRVHDLSLSSDAGDDPVVAEIEPLAEGAGVRIRRCRADQIERRARTDAPQGVVAIAAPVAASPSSTTCSATRAPSSSRSTASPTRGTSAR